MSNVLCSRLNEDTNMWEQVHNVNGGVGITLSWEQIGNLLRRDGTMKEDEYVAKIRADADGVHFYFERKASQ